MIGRLLRDHPRTLERSYVLFERVFLWIAPVLKSIGLKRVEKIILWPEKKLKESIFDCRMCGQCILHSTGMTCPMTCPKNLRNGPCGGVREDGHCEVKPEMMCIWTEAYHRSLKMKVYQGEMMDLNPIVNHSLKGKSAWVTLISGADLETPAGWTWHE